MIEKDEFLKSFGCKIEEFDPGIDYSEFYSILRQDWLKGVDISLPKNLSNNIGVYQVISCIDVSVPKYKIENVVNDEDNKEEEDYSYKGSKNKKTSRMLKVVLFDGHNQHLLFEYEQISIFDVFYNNSTSSMSRCCAKIALHSSPAYRRNAFWVTNSNVKLLFEGYSCKLHRHLEEEPSEDIGDQILLSDNDNIGYNSQDRLNDNLLASFGANTRNINITGVSSSTSNNNSNSNNDKVYRSDMYRLKNDSDNSSSSLRDNNRAYDSRSDIYNSKNLYSNKTSYSDDYEYEPVSSYSMNESQMEVSQDIIDLANKFLDNVPINLEKTNQNVDNNNNNTRDNKDSNNNDNVKIEDLSIFDFNSCLNREVDLKDAPDINEYFTPESDYIQHSYICFIKKHELAFNNETFLKFSNERFLDKLIDMEINLTNLCNILNFSCNIEIGKSNFTGDYSEYKFGFLNHSSVVLCNSTNTNGNGNNEKDNENEDNNTSNSNSSNSNDQLSQILSNIVEKIFHTLDKKVWFAIFDDCVCPGFCIFTLDTFPYLLQSTEELAISIVLNSLEGFFLFEDFMIEGNKIRVLKSFLEILPPKDMKDRIKVVNDEYLKVKQDILF